MITSPFYTYRVLHFTSGNTSFFCDIYLSLSGKAACRSGRLDVHLLVIIRGLLRQSSYNYCLLTETRKQTSLLLVIIYLYFSHHTSYK